MCPQDYDYAAVNSDENVCLYNDERARGEQPTPRGLRTIGGFNANGPENKKSVKMSKLIYSSLSINIISDY